MYWQIECAEFVQWAKSYSGPKFHAVLCDPPYGLEFMGKEWDAHESLPAYQQWTTEWASALLPLLHPGALVFCFGGTRTWHRLACGMEAAGFEMWDTLMWLHGQGFPKAQAIDKLIDRNFGGRDVIGVQQMPGFARANVLHGQQNRSTTEFPVYSKSPKSEQAAPWSGHKTAALKPAWEPVLCFKAPNLGKTYAELALEHGSGALNVDGGRIGVETVLQHSRSAQAATSKGIYGDSTAVETGDPKQGRYPANLALDKEAGGLLGEQARFYYCAKANRKERETGCESLPTIAHGKSGDAQGALNRGEEEYKQESLGLNRVLKIKNDHPTVKPLALNKWLATLLLPADSVTPRRVLIPFAGSGSEMIGAIQAGWNEIIGIEKDSHYCDIARARLTYWEKKLAGVGGQS